MNERKGASSHRLWKRREALLDAFERAWQQGQQPASDDHRPADSGDSLTGLLELIQTELYRGDAGRALERAAELYRIGNRSIILARVQHCRMVMLYLRGAATRAGRWWSPPTPGWGSKGSWRRSG